MIVTMAPSTSCHKDWTCGYRKFCSSMVARTDNGVTATRYKASVFTLGLNEEFAR